MESDRLLARAQAGLDAGRYEEARDVLEGLLKDQPGSSTVLRSLGLVSSRLGQPALANRYYRQAVQSDPHDSEAHFGLALLYLRHGNYEHGWVEYEWRLMRERCVALRYTEGATFWDGRPLRDEALLLHCEQGFGDNIQFIRFLALVRERVKKIHLACHPELVRLFTGLEGLAGIVTDNQPLPAREYHCPLLSLPRIFNVTLATLPNAVPYLPVSGAHRVERGRQPRVGLAWRAKLSSPNGIYKSVPLESLRSLAHLPVDWVCLQQDPTIEEQKILETDFEAERMGSTFRDFRDTADRLETLDLVLTVDTSVAHLAGALGRPTWVLLPRWADWRWLLDRRDSPWYPSVSLYRQETDRDWSRPLQAVRRDLEHALERGVLVGKS